MGAKALEIEDLLGQLHPKYFQELKAYLEYLVYVQQKEEKRPVKPARKKRTNGKQQQRLEAVRLFRGDAPFPNVALSKYDVYEQ